MKWLFLFAFSCLAAADYPEIALHESCALETEDPNHHYGLGLAEAYHKFVLDFPEKGKGDFFSFVCEFLPEIPKVIYLETEEEQEKNRFHIDFEARVLEDLPTENPLMFEMDVNGLYYAHEKIRGTASVKGFHHTSFTAAKGVAFAGAIKIAKDRTIEWISDDSGHFRPLSESLVSLLKSFESQGIPLEKIHLSLRRTTHLVSGAEWLEAYKKNKETIPGENVLNREKGSEVNTNSIRQEISMKKLEEMIPSNPFFISAEEVNEILAISGLKMEELLVQLIPIAKTFARPPVSGYHVGGAALGKSGNIYLGVNLEFLDLPLNAAVHGEQFLIANARNHGETEIIAIALSAAPCGHCRQFLTEIDERGQLQILMPNTPPKTLTALLPEAFGPKDLGLKANLLALPTEYPCFIQEYSLVVEGLKAAFASYAPYSQSRSGIAIQTRDGKIYSGSYLENAAFNPSLSPLQTALVALVSDLRSYEEINEVVLVEQKTGKISQEMPTRALLRQVAPSAHFRLEKRDF